MPRVKRKVTLLRHKHSPSDPDTPPIEAEAFFDTEVNKTLVRKDLGDRMIFFGYYQEPIETHFQPSGESTPRPVQVLGTSSFAFRVNGCGWNVEALMVEPDEIDADLVIGKDDMRRSGIELRPSESEEGAFVLDLEGCIKRTQSPPEIDRI